MAFKFNWDKELLDATFVEKLRCDLNTTLQKVIAGSPVRMLELTLLDFGTQVHECQTIDLNPSSQNFCGVCPHVLFNHK